LLVLLDLLLLSSPVIVADNRFLDLLADRFDRVEVFRFGDDEEAVDESAGLREDAEGDSIGPGLLIERAVPSTGSMTLVDRVEASREGEV
jgi:hypothetical protein